MLSVYRLDEAQTPISGEIGSLLGEKQIRTPSGGNMPDRVLEWAIDGRNMR